MKSHQFNEPSLEQQAGEQFERAANWLNQRLPRLLIIGAGYIGVLWLSSGVFSVDPGHVGVVRTFGKETARTEPGLNYRFPWPFQQADVVSVEQIRRIEVGFRARDRLHLETMETMEKILPDTDKVILAGDLGQRLLPLMPLGTAPLLPSALRRPGVLPLRAQPPELRTVPRQTQHAPAVSGLSAFTLSGRSASRRGQDTATPRAGSNSDGRRTV